MLDDAADTLAGDTDQRRTNVARSPLIVEHSDCTPSMSPADGTSASRLLSASRRALGNDNCSVQQLIIAVEQQLIAEERAAARALSQLPTMAVWPKPVAPSRGYCPKPLTVEPEQPVVTRPENDANAAPQMTEKEQDAEEVGNHSTSSHALTDHSSGAGDSASSPLLAHSRARSLLMGALRRKRVHTTDTPAVASGLPVPLLPVIPAGTSTQRTHDEASSSSTRQDRRRRRLRLSRGVGMLDETSPSTSHAGGMRRTQLDLSSVEESAGDAAELIVSPPVVRPISVSPPVVQPIMVECPICGDFFSQQAIEAHASSCQDFDVQEAEAQPPPPPPASLSTTTARPTADIELSADEAASSPTASSSVGAPDVSAERCWLCGRHFADGSQLLMHVARCSARDTHQLPSGNVRVALTRLSPRATQGHRPSAGGLDDHRAEVIDSSTVSGTEESVDDIVEDSSSSDGLEEIGGASGGRVCGGASFVPISKQRDSFIDYHGQFRTTTNSSSLSQSFSTRSRGSCGAARRRYKTQRGRHRRRFQNRRR